MSNIIKGKCFCCGSVVYARKPFLGKMEFYCKTSPCYPAALAEWDSMLQKQIENLLSKDN